jgi:hypothetical protein
MANKSDLFTIGTGPTKCGILYLKVLLSQAEVDSRALAGHVRSNLAQLNVYMVQVAKNDVAQFNTYVEDQLRLLETRGETTQDLLTNLFTGYLSCEDKEFVANIKQIKRDYDFHDKDVTPEQLRAEALKIYQRRHDLEHEWMEPSEEQEQIIALKAEVKKLLTTKDPKTVPAQRTNPSNRANKRQKKKNPMQSAAWRKVPPSTGEPNTKKHNGQTVHWCVHHKCWLSHSSAECRLGQAKPQSKTSSVKAMMADVGIEDIDDVVLSDSTSVDEE